MEWRTEAGRRPDDNSTREQIRTRGFGSVLCALSYFGVPGRPFTGKWKFGRRDGAEPGLPRNLLAGVGSWRSRSTTNHAKGRARPDTNNQSY